MLVDFILYTDASTSVGCGGEAYKDDGGPPIDHLPGRQLRWTRLELDTFASMGVSINVLEFFGAVYYLMLWVDLFRGKTVMLRCDNTSAVAWLLAGRAKCGELKTADAIVKLFTLFTLRNNIVALSRHVPGVNNVAADTNSRDLALAPQDSDESVAGTLSGINSLTQTREERCRTLLMRCVLRPDSLRGVNLVDEVIALDGIAGASASAT